MNRGSFLLRESTGVMVIDVQEKLCSHLDRIDHVLAVMEKAIKGFQLLRLPIIATEQYPEGLGKTVGPIKACLGEGQKYFSKTTFSCFGDEAIKKHALSLPVEQWILIGVEAHVCIFQTAKEIQISGKQAVVLNDAITSRSVYDFSTAIAEMRDIGVRISSTETVLFELLKDSRSQEFKRISLLVK